MHKTQHARKITERFQELVTDAGDSLPEQHYDELVLLIEAGIDTVLVERLESIASQLQKMAQNIRSDAERFD